MAEGTRKLAAIMSADVVGYSRLMAADEAATVATLREYRAAIARVIERHKGRVVNAPGDNILAEFPSAVEGVQAAIEAQKVLEGRNLELAPDRRMDFRIGLNLGDVIEADDGTIYGDGVNIAARMEALAEAGGVCISSTVYDAVSGKVDFGFDFLGAQEVKNIDHPINVYRVRTTPGAAKAMAKARRRRPSLAVLAGAGAAVVIAVGVAAWFALRAPAPETVTEAPTDPVLSMPTGPVIAVLPFANQSGDPAQDYFSTGLTEDLIIRLSRFQQFKVIARNSTARYKGETVDLAAILSELGARYVVDGGVRRSGDRLRVTVDLTDATDGARLWGQTYDRDLSAADVFEIQDDIAGRVVAVIADFQGIILRAGIKDSMGKPPADLESYDCQLRLVPYYDAVTPEEHAIIRDCAERAVARDPTDAGAWWVLSFAYLDENRFNFNSRPGSLDRALEAAQRAVQFDANSADAHLSLAQVHFGRNEMDAFTAESEQALALNPNNASYLAVTGLKMIEAGMLDRGIALMDKAVDLNPSHPDWYHWAYYHYHFRRGEYDAALSAIQKISWPDYFWTHAQTAAVLGHLGRLDKARASVDRLLELYPDFVDHFWDEIAKWNVPDKDAMLYVEGYRKAGLDVPDKPALSY